MRRQVRLWTDDCICTALLAAYRRGYNDRARSAEYSYQVYGIPEFNQHGKGENP